jgi:hypothetical protein
MPSPEWTRALSNSDILAMDASIETVVAELNVKVFIAHAEALKKLGMWDTFMAQNKDLVEQLMERLESP